MRDLLTAAGYDVVEAHDGLVAAQTAAELRPELIVMDIQLPILNGYEATRLMRANPALRNVPIIAVTSYALSGDDEKARAAGCNGYIAKPFSPRQLLATIRGFLD
jgi:two-component system cell cycle response regulator DivK